MTGNRRIVLNIFASYGRTLLGAACGVFATRWVLMALGQESFGIYGVVCSMAVFVSFLNIQFSGAIGRFYAFSIGKATICDDKRQGLDECRTWFTTGVLIHTLLPLILVAIGYPVGHYVISHGLLNVPAERIETCIWLWRFLMVSCFVAMINIPFGAMYIAKQYIAEITIYSVFQVIVRTGFIYCMTLVEKDWLLVYGLGMCIISIAPQIIIIVRAILVFPECRFSIPSCGFIRQLKELASYAWWQVFCGVGYMARHQVIDLIVNKFFGPKVNASFSVGSTLGGEAATLTAALNGAFSPALTTAYGANKFEEALMFAYRSSKFGTLLTLLFAVPMIVELEGILLLWLKTPPQFTYGLCLCWLIIVVVEKLAMGHLLLVNASGRIAKFYLARGLMCITAIPFTLCAAYMWRSVYAVGIGLICTTCLVSLSDAIMSKICVGTSLRYWVFSIIFPTVGVALIGVAVGEIVKSSMGSGIFRILIVSMGTSVVMAISSWILICDKSERKFIIDRINKFLRKVHLR